MGKKVIRLTENELVNIIKTVMKENLSYINEDYVNQNPEIKISKLDWGGKSNEIIVNSNGKNFAYKINYSERLGSADGSDNFKVNFKDINQSGNNLVINRWVSGGKTEPVEISFNDIKVLTTGQPLIKDTGLGKVHVIPTGSW